MKNIQVTIKSDHLVRVANSTPQHAIEELIWNSLDAGATQVEVRLVENDLGSIDQVIVEDNGHGIFYPDVELLFGNLGDSWKLQKRKANGRSLHGKKGEGRFKAFSLGNHVSWNTTCSMDGSQTSYSITGLLSDLQQFTVTDTKDVSNKSTGTTVVISNTKNTLNSLKSESVIQDLTKSFSAFLDKYRGISIRYLGEEIDSEPYQGEAADLKIQNILLDDGRKIDIAISVVEWRLINTKRLLYLCDADGVPLHEIEVGINTPGFKFTAHIMSEVFRDLHQENLLDMEDLQPDVRNILSAARDKLRDYFRERAAAEKSHIIERWKAEEIYPFEEKSDLTSLEKAERQMFDILAVNVEAYLPKFQDSDQNSKKFTFRLLSQAIKENPESVQRIISSVLDLKKEDQDDLAELLKKTSLTYVIKSAKEVANRLDFLIGLENLVVDKDTKKSLLERDELHKILETEAWIFNEDFALSGSEKRLEEVLKIHLKLLGKQEDEVDVVEREGGKSGRVDLMLSRAVKPRHGEQDYLIVELKRPSQKITSEVLTQIESYALAVAQDSRFRSEKAKWDFLVVSEEMDDFAKRKARQRNKPVGLVFDDGDLNIRVWAKEWGEVINDARTRLEFLNEHLQYDVDRDSATDYLIRTHSKYIPDSVNDVQENSDAR